VRLAEAPAFALNIVRQVLVAQSSSREADLQML